MHVSMHEGAGVRLLGVGGLYALFERETHIRIPKVPICSLAKEPSKLCSEETLHNSKSEGFFSQKPHKLAFEVRRGYQCCKKKQKKHEGSYSISFCSPVRLKASLPSDWTALACLSHRMLRIVRDKDKLMLMQMNIQAVEIN